MRFLDKMVWLHCFFFLIFSGNVFCSQTVDAVGLGINIELNNIQTSYDNCNTYSSDCNFWIFGNAFDTTLTTLSLQQQNLIKLNFNTNAYIQKTSAVFHKLTQPTQITYYWFDDFEWWSVAMQRALSPQNIGIFNSADVHLLQVMKNTAWSHAQLGTQAWQSCLQSSQCKQKYDASATNNFEPPYAGGIWNNFFRYSTTSRATSDPYTDGLGARENTVTNGMYAVYATAAYENIKPDPITQSQYQHISTFFHDWFTDSSTTKNIINPIDQNTALVKERSFTSGDPYYDPTLAWAGDQGIVLGWLTEILNAPATVKTALDKKTALILAEQIIRGAQQCLVNQSTRLIMPWTYWNPAGGTQLCGTSTGSAPGGDPQDYNTGPGVFVRYLTEAYQTNAALRTFIQQKTSFPNIIANEAIYLAGSTGKTDHTTCTHKSECSPLVDSINKLAIYNADKVMSQNSLNIYDLKIDQS